MRIHRDLTEAKDKSLYYVMVPQETWSCETTRKQDQFIS